jgi:APA family basic amino acid/polyamine antiporter
MPAVVAEVSPRTSSPAAAVVVIGAIVAALTLLGDVRVTWSFSAFTVLVYYAITNLAALRLPAEQRRYPRLVPVAGLLGCLSLAFFVEPAVWAAGLGVLAAGLLWHRVARSIASRSSGAR